MAAASAQGLLFVIGTAIAALAFVGLVFGANALLSPRKPTAEKLEPFECGMEQQATPHVNVPLRYSAIAVLFVIFDAEAVLLFSVATRLHGSLVGALSVLGFVACLGVGLVYAWKTGALQWRW